MKQRALIIVIAAVFLLGVLGCVFVLNMPKKNTVRISSGGKTLYTLDLSREPDRVFEISAGGGVNIIEIKDGRIRVESADCPDQTCVKMGWLSSSATPVVCLPHKLVIEFADAGDNGGVDVVAE